MLLYWAKTEELVGLNGSGRSPHAADLGVMRAFGLSSMPREGILSVTVPGAMDGWVEALSRYGRMPLSRLLRPAIALAEEGFPVTPLIAHRWGLCEGKLRRYPESASQYLLKGRAPRAGEVFRQPHLARTLRLIAEGGREVFYRGEIARAMVEASERSGGLLTLRDFEDHRSTWVSPISADYRGFRLHELPPNGQGITALLALNICAGFDVSALGFHTPAHCHLILEALKLAFADRDRYVADPEVEEVPVEALLSEAYSQARRAEINWHRASERAEPGRPPGSDTVYIAAADPEGNMCSFINSIYSSFGSGVTAGETGILLQNRGTGFVLEEGHPNCLKPHKRPLHTLIPAFLTRGGRPYAAFGVMGADFQPQGHLQVVLNHVDFGLDLQEAIDAARVRYLGGLRVAVEEEIPPETIRALERLGHHVIVTDHLNENFGGGQGIIRDPETGVYLAASDRRKDGLAMGY
jgi:gamma-glutamyltranspeptidase/glutathione hydrolase